jgi:hypothetical protein
MLAMDNHKCSGSKESGQKQGTKINILWWESKAGK